MIGFIADIEFVWGFQCKIVGLSKSSPSFYYIPPTVILGSIAESIAKEHDLGEENGKSIIPKLSTNLLAIGIRPLNCIPLRFSDINKLIAIKQTAGKLYPDPNNLAASFDAPSVGKTMLSTIDSNPPTLRCFIVFKNDKINFNDNEFVIDKDAFWCIHRLGSKESRVSVTDVEVFEPEIVDKKCTTNYSFPFLDGISPKMIKEYKWIEENYINPFALLNYDKHNNPIRYYLEGKNILRFKLPYLISSSKPEYIVEFSNNIIAYKHKEEVVIGKCQ